MNGTRGIRRLAVVLALMIGTAGALGAPAFARSGHGHQGRSDDGAGRVLEGAQGARGRRGDTDADVGRAVLDERDEDAGDEVGGGEVISGKEAARRAQSRYGGRVLSVDRDDEEDGQPGYKVKLLHDGTVRIVNIKGHKNN